MTRYRKDCRADVQRVFDEIEPLECIDYCDPSKGTEGPTIACRTTYEPGHMWHDPDGLWMVSEEYEEGWQRALAKGMIRPGERYEIVGYHAVRQRGPFARQAIRRRGPFVYQPDPVISPQVGELGQLSLFGEAGHVDDV